MDNNMYAKLGALSYVEYEDRLWFSAVNRNGLFSCRKNGRDTLFHGAIPNEDLMQEVLYYDVCKVGKYLVFSPHGAKEIALYNLERKKFEKIKLKDDINGKNAKHYDPLLKFWRMIALDTKIYFLGYSYPAIIKLDIESKKLTYIDSWLDELEFSDLKDSEDRLFKGYFGDGGFVFNQKIIIPIAGKSSLMYLDPEDDSFVIKDIKTSFDGIGGIAKLNENIIMVGRGENANRIAVWNMDKDDLQEIIIEGEDTWDPFYAPVIQDNTVILMPISAKHSYAIDISTQNVRVNNALDKYLSNNDKPNRMPWKTMAVKYENACIRFISGKDLMWHLWDCVSEVCNDYIVETTDGMDEYEKSIFDTFVANQDPIPEDKMSLQNFIQFI